MTHEHHGAAAASCAPHTSEGDSLRRERDASWTRVRTSDDDQGGRCALLFIDTEKEWL